MQKHISIIIVNWNGKELLKNCFATIAKYPPSVPSEVIVVDNASTDGSQEWLESDEPREILGDIPLVVIKNEENLGFGRANNIGIEKTKAPVIFLLNPDTLVKPKAIDILYETLNSEPRIGAVAPKLLNQDGSEQLNIWDRAPTPLSILVNGFKLNRFLFNRFLSNSMNWKRGPVPAFSGAAIMAKREMIDQVGGFDPSFYMFGEDGEWCFRINKSNWITFYEPEAEIVHIGGQSALLRWGSEFRRIKEEEGFILFQYKCLSRPHFKCNLIARYFVLKVHYIKNKLMGKQIKQLQEICKIYKDAIWND